MLNAESTRRMLVALLVGSLGTTALVGCSTPPKPNELVELERILQAPDALAVRDAPGTDKYYREARQYRRVSVKAWESGDLELAREYAMYGAFRYRTAVALKEQVEENRRLQAANAQIAAINPDLKALSEERNKLVLEVSKLQQDVVDAQSAKAAAQRRDLLRQQQLNQGGATASAERLAARNKLDAAKIAQGDALRVQADEFASSAYTRANNMLDSAQMLYESDAADPRDVEYQASQALDLFKAAIREAQPKYQAAQDSLKPDVSRAKLLEEATNTFGAPFVVHEGTGVRIILAATFEQNSTQVRPASQAQVVSAARLAAKFTNATLSIEGYTRRGDATENLAISAARARSVRDVFAAEGVDTNRMTTHGEGQAALRYPNDPASNDRVEVTFRIQE